MLIAVILSLTALYLMLMGTSVPHHVESDTTPEERPTDLGGHKASTGEMQPVLHQTHANAPPVLEEVADIFTEKKEESAQTYSSSSRLRSDESSSALHDFLSVHGDPNVDNRPPRPVHP